jgi:uncharacterized protein (TIGR02266 family)
VLASAYAVAKPRPIPREARIRVNRELDALAGTIHAYASDVSRSGVFFRTRTPRPVGTRVRLAFSVIIDDIETIRGVGEVVRVSEGGMGVRFLELDSASRDVLARLLARASERGEAEG